MRLQLGVTSLIMGTQEDNRDNAPLQLTTGTGPAGHTGHWPKDPNIGL